MDFRPKTAKEILQELEVDYAIPGLAADREKAFELIPFTGRKNVKNLLWNLLTCDKYRKDMTGNTYNEIFNTLMDRLNAE